MMVITLMCVVGFGCYVLVCCLLYVLNGYGWMCCGGVGGWVGCLLWVCYLVWLGFELLGWCFELVVGLVELIGLVVRIGCCGWLALGVLFVWTCCLDVLVCWVCCLGCCDVCVLCDCSYFVFVAFVW